MLQRGIVANIEAIEVHVVGLGTCFPGVGAEDAAKVRLPKLIAAARRSPPEFDSTCTEQPHHAIAQSVIGLLENQREGIIRLPSTAKSVR